MAVYECPVCGYEYDEDVEGTPWEALPEDWECPVCGAEKAEFEAQEAVVEDTGEPAAPEPDDADDLNDYLRQWRRKGESVEPWLADIQQMAIEGDAILEPMGTRQAVIGWDDLLIRGAQLARLPVNGDEPVSLRTTIGPQAAQPMVLELPVLVSHMSYGALSREIKIALAKGSAAAQTAICSGEGGILPEERDAAYRYIFEYVPNGYSVTEENLQRADAIEIKIGQSAKPGMGGHLPGSKVTPEIAQVRQREAGKDIISPAHFADITDTASLKRKIDWLRETSLGRPIGVKLAAGRLEDDLQVVLDAGPDFVTVDGRPGATGAAPKSVKAATSMPTVFALYRARRFLDQAKADDVSLIITGGLRSSADYAKALALGADAIAIATAALVAAACQQYRVCHTGKCPVGVATQDPELRARLDIVKSAKRLENYLAAVAEELGDFTRLTGNRDIHQLSVEDLCTPHSEISEYTTIAHV